MKTLPLGETLASSNDFPSPRVGYVYALVEESEPERVRYIGSTWEPRHRLYSHLHYGITGRALAAWLYAIHQRGGVVLMRLLTTATNRRTLYELEGWQLDEYRAIGQADVNGQHTRPSYSRVA